MRPTTDCRIVIRHASIDTAPQGGLFAECWKAVPGANKKDHVSYNGMEVYYNGVGTIKKKARYAKKNLGGIMIWELTMDTASKSKSLLQAIGNINIYQCQKK